LPNKHILAGITLDVMSHALQVSWNRWLRAHLQSSNLAASNSSRELIKPCVNTYFPEWLISWSQCITLTAF